MGGAAGALAAVEALKLLTGRGSELARTAARLDLGAVTLVHEPRERAGDCPICAAGTL